MTASSTAIASVLNARVERLEVLLMQLPQTFVPIEHLVCNGMYSRTMAVQPDMTITGAKHYHDHICIVDGDITVSTDAGLRRLTGRHVLVGRAGFKRAGYTHSLTHWTTISRTTKTGIIDIEDELFEEPDLLQTRTMALPEPSMDRNDYARFLAEYHLSDDDVRRMVDDMDDHADLPTELTLAYIGPSPIHGRGLFAGCDIGRGVAIALGRIGQKRTIVGRQANHSPLPSCQFLPTPDGGALLVARRDIGADTELTVDYRQAAALSDWARQPHQAEMLATLRQRVEAFKILGGDWARWAAMDDIGLGGVLGGLLDLYGCLPSVDAVQTQFDAAPAAQGA